MIQDPQTSENRKLSRRPLTLKRTKNGSKITGTQNMPIFTLKDLINVSAFQVLLDSFSGLLGLATAILDLQGEILAASGWQEICTDFHRKHPDATARCRKSDTVLAGKLAQGEVYNVYQCENGLVDIAVPIIIDQTHVGNLFIGQFLFESPDINKFIKQAEVFAFDKTAYLQALSKVPVCSHKQIQRTVDFLKNLTTVIGDEGLNKKKLLELNWQLEQRVQERTRELSDSHERLRVLCEAAFEGIIISDNGIIVEANGKVATILGYAHPSELVGTRMTNLLAPEYRADAEGKITTGYDKPYESMALTKNGDTFPIAIQARMFVHQGRFVRATAIQNLIEKKKAEQEIQSLREILPLCSFCKKVRNDTGYWEQVETYIRKHTTTDISHSICPDCLREHYPAEYKSLVQRDSENA